MRFLVFALVIVAALGAFLVSRQKPRAAPPMVASASPALPSKVTTAPASSALPAVDAEPDEASLERVLRAEYAQIERQGGMPLVVTATGQRIVVHPKLYSLKKEKCHRVSAFGPTAWECDVATTGTLHDGDKPLPSGERVTVKRGPGGDWISV